MRVLATLRRFFSKATLINLRNQLQWHIGRDRHLLEILWNLHQQNIPKAKAVYEKNCSLLRGLYGENFRFLDTTLKLAFEGSHRPVFPSDQKAIKSFFREFSLIFIHPFSGIYGPYLLAQASLTLFKLSGKPKWKNALLGAYPFMMRRKNPLEPQHDSLGETLLCDYHLFLASQKLATDPAAAKEDFHLSLKHYSNILRSEKSQEKAPEDLVTSLLSLIDPLFPLDKPLFENALLQNKNPFSEILTSLKTLSLPEKILSRFRAKESAIQQFLIFCRHYEHASKKTFNASLNLIPLEALFENTSAFNIKLAIFRHFLYTRTPPSEFPVALNALAINEEEKLLALEAEVEYCVHTHNFDRADALLSERPATHKEPTSLLRLRKQICAHSSKDPGALLKLLETIEENTLFLEISTLLFRQLEIFEDFFSLDIQGDLLDRLLSLQEHPKLVLIRAKRLHTHSHPEEAVRVLQSLNVEKTSPLYRLRLEMLVDICRVFRPRLAITFLHTLIPLGTSAERLEHFAEEDRIAAETLLELREKLFEETPSKKSFQELFRALHLREKHDPKETSYFIQRLALIEKSPEFFEGSLQDEVESFLSSHFTEKLLESGKAKEIYALLLRLKPHGLKASESPLKAFLINCVFFYFPDPLSFRALKISSGRAFHEDIAALRKKLSQHASELLPITQKHFEEALLAWSRSIHFQAALASNMAASSNVPTAIEPSGGGNTPRSISPPGGDVLSTQTSPTPSPPNSPQRKKLDASASAFTSAAPVSQVVIDDAPKPIAPDAAEKITASLNKTVGAPLLRALLDILARIKSAGPYQAFWTGGMLRDGYLGIRPRDFDLVTDIPGPKLQRLFGGYLRASQGLPGLFSLTLPNFPSAQIDIYTHEMRSLEEDARQRIASMNALYMDATGSIFDPTEKGVPSLQKREIALVAETSQTQLKSAPHLLMKLAIFCKTKRLTFEKGFKGAVEKLTASDFSNAPYIPLFLTFARFFTQGSAERSFCALINTGALSPLFGFFIGTNSPKKKIFSLLNAIDKAFLEKNQVQDANAVLAIIFFAKFCCVGTHDDYKDFRFFKIMIQKSCFSYLLQEVHAPILEKIFGLFSRICENHLPKKPLLVRCSPLSSAASAAAVSSSSAPAAAAFSIDDFPPLAPSLTS